MTPWALAFTPRAARVFAAMPSADRSALDDRLARLAVGDRAGLDVKKLQGQVGVWRLRSGDWRIGFTYQTPSRTLLISWISQRKDAY